MSGILRAIPVLMALVGMLFAPIVYAQGCLVPMGCCAIEAPEAQDAAINDEAGLTHAPCCPLPASAPEAHEDGAPADHQHQRTCSECRCCTAARVQANSPGVAVEFEREPLVRRTADPGRFVPSRTLQPEPGPPKA